VTLGQQVARDQSSVAKKVDRDGNGLAVRPGGGPLSSEFLSSKHKRLTLTTDLMFHVVLYQPEIPPNTGNVIRLCANTGVHLHLVRPLGFRLAHRDLRRAGLDYHEYADLRIHDDWSACRAALAGHRLFAFSTRASRRYDAPGFAPRDAFVFGPEASGLPTEVLAEFPSDRCLRLPMKPGSRSLNLSNAVAVVVYEAWRQAGFDGGI
jgi:tRNA (cytidine/uridine-2'-O-)-methyltransferase